jgi:hypothetical protein
MPGRATAATEGRARRSSELAPESRATVEKVAILSSRTLWHPAAAQHRTSGRRVCIEALSIFKSAEKLRIITPYPDIFKRVTTHVAERSWSQRRQLQHQISALRTGGL